MKLVVLGATGMLGHKLLQQLSQGHEAWGTVRGELSGAPNIAGVEPGRLIGGVTVSDLGSIRRAIESVGADAVINCIGIVKQIDAANDAIASIAINALLPHQLARICADLGARLIHFSTDCVFAGRGGPYRESDPTDPTDLYGRSKLLGEVDRPGCFTLRSSIVGRELRRGTGLFDWFFSQRGAQVRGYRHALYTGLTTLAMADVVRFLLESHPGLSGVWHVASAPIDKCSLLELVNQVYGLGVQIVPDETFLCDRRLDGSRFREATGWVAPTWQSMIETMHADPLL
ncbi:SDR family oxidoreductase [uncultured Thiodictyon sp.]|uniref:dTDP-4-dehydrorhamnose reductase family protein n=1 Tax=uncultured Thiodictyon sp. TaxID=1846217 RepID=UPI0025FDA2DB|nr:SDR family oxidoreductase [uncultured Thiodictyon sp.]